MIGAIELLRQTADKCEQKAKTTADRIVKAELYDMTARWHWLAGEAAKLHDRAAQLEKVQGPPKLVASSLSTEHRSVRD
jgi:hypothetical protein